MNEGKLVIKLKAGDLRLSTGEAVKLYNLLGSLLDGVDPEGVVEDYHMTYDADTESPYVTLSLRQRDGRKVNVNLDTEMSMRLSVDADALASVADILGVKFLTGTATGVVNKTLRVLSRIRVLDRRMEDVTRYRDGLAEWVNDEVGGELVGEGLSATIANGMPVSESDEVDEVDEPTRARFCVCGQCETRDDDGGPVFVRSAEDLLSILMGGGR